MSLRLISMLCLGWFCSVFNLSIAHAIVTESADQPLNRICASASTIALARTAVDARIEQGAASWVSHVFTVLSTVIVREGDHQYFVCANLQFYCPGSRAVDNPFCGR